MSQRFTVRLIACALLFAAPHAFARDALLDNFREPPQSAKPRVWWHWMNGNVTRTGIKADLDWMKRVGIGGVDAIDASIDTPQVVKKRIVYMSPEWKQTFRYAAGLTGKYGMELSIDSSPGWSETGGPWVKPQAAMKKLVWSSIALEGGKPFHGALPAPPAVPGPFQNIRKAAKDVPDFYKDALVLAWRQPVDAPVVAGVTSNAGDIQAAALDDGDLATAQTLMPGGDGKVWLRVAYEKPTQIQGVTLALSTNDDLGFAARVEASDDGVSWRRIADVPPAAQVRRFALLQQTIAFPATTARFFRLVVTPAAPIPNSLRIVDRAPGLADAPAAAKAPEPRRYNVYELAFRAAATVNEFEKKAGFAIARDNYAIANGGPAAPGSAIDPTQVMDVTSHVRDGVLDWTPPPGRWTVLRLGYSLTGAQNHPATAEATGLEVDKLAAADVRDYIEHYLDTYADAAGPLFGKRGLSHLVVDSTEVGAQNWTATMLADFKRLRGYDPVPWLPTLTGAVVKNAAESDRFLWDFRQTINQLLAQNHYGTIAGVAKARGLTTYMEATEDHRPTFGDDMDMRRFADIPTGAMWTYVGSPRATYVADLLGAASVAHVYGRPLVGAESLTSAGQPWNMSPRDLKPVADMEFVLGVNRLFIHTSVHQPVDRPPGLSLFGYGQFFNRLESWAEQAGGWMRYLARCSYLLSQGRFDADIAYFYGQEAPLTGEFGDHAVDMPPGYGFDFVGADAILNQMKVDHGALVTKSGMRYRLLYLGGSSRMMTMDVLRRIRDLVEQGAVVVGAAPQASPSLADDQAIFRALAENLFGAPEGRFGQGRVFARLDDALKALTLTPDFDYAKPGADSRLLYIHRSLADGELYFVSNRRDHAGSFDASFRVSGMGAQLLDAVTGRITAAAVTQKDGRSHVALALPAYGSVFVLFRKGAAIPPRALDEKVIATLKGPWRVSFQPGRGAPKAAIFTDLTSWSDSDVAGIKYFSGTADYVTHFTLRAGRPGRLTLDLGSVREVAEVTLNGKTLGTAWTAPYALDITTAVRPGRNELKVRVANLWVNRLIGDAQPDAKQRYTFTTIPTYRADAPLRPSGLLGPVTIRASH
jgi:hypothetical protein